MSARTKISVAVITYNQQSTIRQTLDSILCQKGDFDLEVVIGEDCSTDNTRAICEEYAKQSQIILLPSQKNLGIMTNFARVMKVCTGDYVGICAGDDYWCDERKLQKQLDYFHTHPEVGVVSTAGYKLLVRSNQLVPNVVAPVHPISDGNIKPFYFSPNYRGGVYAMPLSLLIKRDLLQYVDFAEFVRRGFPVEDYPMQAILAQHTRWGHILDLCVVYRVYKESATFISFDHPNYLQYHQGLANIRRYLNELFPADICFSESQLQEQVFYKEYLLYLHRFEYINAKQLVADAPAIIADTARYRQATRFTRTRLNFIVFHFYKECTNRKELNRKV